MRELLLDTHVWIWFVNGDKTLSSKIHHLINRNLQTKSVFIAAISIWELSMLVSKKRMSLNMPCLEWVRKSLAVTGIQIIALSPEIAVDSAELPGSFHGDPADRMIIATARICELDLLTRDAKLLSYSKQHYVKTNKV